MKPGVAVLLLSCLLTPAAASPQDGTPAAPPTQPAQPEAAGEGIQALVEELGAAERAFAATVRSKDLAAFASFLDDGAVFAAGQALRGREAIVAGWAGLFAPEAPVLAWEPCVVEIEASGRIGFTRGPYWFENRPAAPGPDEPAAAAEEAQGMFFSVWERQPDGAWKIILDTGTPPEPGPPVTDPCPTGAPAD